MKKGEKMSFKGESKYWTPKFVMRFVYTKTSYQSMKT